MRSQAIVARVFLQIAEGLDELLKKLLLGPVKLPLLRTRTRCPVDTKLFLGQGNKSKTHEREI